MHLLAPHSYPREMMSAGRYRSPLHPSSKPSVRSSSKTEVDACRPPVSLTAMSHSVCALRPGRNANRAARREQQSYVADGIAAISSSCVAGRYRSAFAEPESILVAVFLIPLQYEQHGCRFRPGRRFRRYVKRCHAILQALRRAHWPITLVRSTVCAGNGALTDGLGAALPLSLNEIDECPWTRVDGTRWSRSC